MRGWSVLAALLPASGVLAGVLGVASVSAPPAAAAELDNAVLALVSVDRLEYRAGGGPEALAAEGELTIGNDDHKLALRLKSTRLLDEGAWEGADLHVLYRRPLTAFLDLNAGVRHDWSPDPEATHLTLGVSGLLPQWIEFWGAGYVSDDGDVSARIEAETEWFVTRRVFLEPSLELDLSASENAARGIGQGIAKVEAGLRLHYAVTGGLSPYVGLHHEAKLGETADFARAHGEDPDATSWVAGVRFAY